MDRTIQELLAEHINRLERCIQYAKEALSRAPDGSLRVCMRGQKAYYYHRLHGREDGGTYIKSADIDVAHSLAQKDYYEKPLKLITGEIIHPDFTVLHERTRKTMYLEHFGKMGDGEYAEKNMNRINKYIDSGIYPGVQLLITHETDVSPLNMRRLERLFRAWFL